jgi:hypothetical protein
MAGAINESVTVQSDAVLIDTSKADRGEVIEQERVTELPLNGRNPLLLALLSPGVKYVGNPSGTSLRPFDDPQQNFSINGSQPGQTQQNIDGVGNATSTAASRLAYTPPVDSVQEFKIVTNPYDAQYGRSGGGPLTLASNRAQTRFMATSMSLRGALDWTRTHGRTTISTVSIIPMSKPVTSSISGASRWMAQSTYQRSITVATSPSSCFNSKTGMKLSRIPS